MKHKILLSILAFLISISALSGPARKGIIYLTQPDGTSFGARITGDEFMKTVTTLDGSSITQDEGGWWCYARYDAEGGKFSSGHRVGPDAPADVRSLSRDIPYSRLAVNAAKKRGAAPREAEPIMKRLSRKRGVMTKNGENEAITKHGIIILAQFKDVGFTYTREDFIDMLTKEGYSVNGATGSAKEYFDAQFNGAFEFSFDVSPIVTLPFNMSYYGRNGKDGTDSAPAEMIIDACRLADDDVDFSLYDDDDDGEVDNVFVFFAGGDEAEGAGEDCIWSHAWYVFSGADKEEILDGRLIDRYACTAELSRRYETASKYKDVLAGIGTFCHEYFHTFGIPDMYDTDYEESGGTAAGLWSSTSLMDAGNQNNYGNTPPNLNAVEREYLGISEPQLIEANGGYSMEAIHLGGRYYRLNTDHENEYYLLEYRSEEGWDKYCGGSGMLVYHIDRSDRSAGYSDSYSKETTAVDSWETYNEVNTRPDHQCADLIEADGRPDSFDASEDESLYRSLSNIRGIFFPYSETNSLTPDSSPGLSFWSGNVAEASITNIRRTEGGVAFNVIGFSETDVPPEVASIKAEAFMDAAIILFESDREFEGEAMVEWGKTGGETEKVTVRPYLPGKYSITLEGLQPDNKTYTVKVHFELDGLVGETGELSFMTKKTPAVKWPFIYMNGVVRNSDNTLPAGARLPLRVYNASDAAEIRWEFDGSTVTVGSDGYFTVEKSGILKAHITREDGSTEIIMKEITIGKEDKK